MRKLFEGENVFFYSILFIAAALRLFHYYSWSFTHDELGAFARLNYSSFSEIISEGVKNNDTHPALVQVFLFVWSKLFGLSEASIRFPFVAAGVGSVALVYKISRHWFGFTPACFSSLAVALLGFPILYSQLARPYSFGLFFSLLAVWYWTKLLFGDDKKLYLKAAAYGIATALCMLTHYFSFFFAMIVAASGFLFIKRDKLKPYLLSGAIALLIFVPHLSVSLYQFSKGGIGEWLTRPDSDFLWTFVMHAFNDSPLVFISAIAIFIISILIYHLQISISKFHFLCIAWFLLPFLAGYYYSLRVNPVLQYSTLLFSFPFLPMFLFSFFREDNKKLNQLLLGSLAAILLCSTLFEQRVYKKEVFGVFREINEKVLGLHGKYGPEKITTVLNTSDKDIFDFYFQRWEKTVQYDFYAGDEPYFSPEMLKKLDTCTTPYLLYAWSNFRSPYEIPELIKRKFPCMIYDEKHFNSQVTLFGRAGTQDSCMRDTVFFVSAGFERGKRNIFQFDSTKTNTAQVHSGRSSLRITPGNKFCITLKTKVKNIFADNNCVNVSAWVLPLDTFKAQMVMDVGDRNSHEWHAILLKPFGKAVGKWQEVFATFELPATAYPDDEVKIYLWNHDKNSFYLDDFTVSSFADSRYHYYETSYRK